MSLDIVKVINQSRELETYSDPELLQKKAVPFVGQPKKHPTDPGKILLRTNPLSYHPTLLEFRINDIVFAENVNTIAGEDGASMLLSKVWIKKGSIGLKLEPFAVADLSKELL